eukprot:TRINITY_DN2237_c0_g1_i4.p1 TRINITY_DN2237_c0_g1~~TRINITY_DN2237_c0_g1_i4.p1  ORF type:complete len:828 (+),score=219.90 TRINITY_DN2237_c0_g1_i4:130-2613(+)
MNTSAVLLLLSTLLFLAFPTRLSALNSAKTLSGVPTCEAEPSCYGCGNGLCEYPLENCATCPEDCGTCAPCESFCGNGRCEPFANETSCSCPEDCGSCCRDGVCRSDRGENFFTCPSECATSLNVTVLDSTNFQKLPGASVMCYTSHKSLGPMFTNTGDVTFPTVQPGGFNCHVTRPGYQDNSVKLTLTSSSTGVVAYVSLTPLYGSITGYVRDALTGEGLEGARVTCGNGTASFNASVTDVRGGFFLTNLTAGTWTCNTTLDGYSFDSLGGIAPAGGHVQLDFWALPLSTAITGYVWNSVTLQPVPGAKVTCRGYDRFTPYNNTSPFVTEETIANRFGYYYLDNIAPGTTNCTAKSDGYKSQSKNVLVNGNARTRLDFELTGNPASITGVVLDSTINRGVVTANITCIMISYDTSYPIKTNSTSTPVTASSSTIAAFLTNGTFVLSSLQPGMYACTASAHGWTHKTLPVFVRAGVTAYLPFVLDPLPSSIRGTVTTGTGRPIPRARVTCSFPGVDGLSQQPALGPEYTDDLGNFHFDYIIFKSPLLSLSYLCSATQSAFGLGIDTGAINRDDDVSVSIIISSAGLAAVVTSPDTSGVVAGATLSCYNIVTGATYVGTTDRDGVYNFAALPPARYMCTANATGFNMDAKLVDLTREDATGAISFILSTIKFAVRGDVDISSGMIDPTTLILTVRDSTNTIDLLRPVINGTGYFQFQIAAGTYYLNVENGPTYSTLSIPFTVSSSGSNLPANVLLRATRSNIFGNIQSKKRMTLSNIPVDLYGPSGGFMTSTLQMTRETSSSEIWKKTAHTQCALCHLDVLFAQHLRQ